MINEHLLVSVCVMWTLPNQIKRFGETKHAFSIKKDANQGRRHPQDTFQAGQSIYYSGLNILSHSVNFALAIDIRDPHDSSKQEDLPHAVCEREAF